MLAVTLHEFLISSLVRKQRLHTFYFELHLDVGGQLFHHVRQTDADFLLCI